MSDNLAVVKTAGGEVISPKKEIKPKAECARARRQRVFGLRKNRKVARKKRFQDTRDQIAKSKSARREEQRAARARRSKAKAKAKADAEAKAKIVADAEPKNQALAQAGTTDNGNGPSQQTIVNEVAP